ncbi:hypothetical protein DLM77_20940 [Leptospira yasudae]|uniref:Uncharacterized protein n=1 Tax=Leptospira yasudae TaxID=2202201 RepID=A0ABX9LXF8_9LEPT|nr:hypothetical protein DLM77_20940 [Leptospira yasudae]
MNIPDPYSPFISISIDLAGSTKAKQIINKICENDNDHRLQQLSVSPPRIFLINQGIIDKGKWEDNQKTFRYSSK